MLLRTRRSVVAEFIAQGSKLQPGRLDHANLGPFNTEPACPRLSGDRTYGGQPDIDANDPYANQQVLKVTPIHVSDFV